ncbi:sporulation integral membrane protein YlbJ [Desulfallas thermosapovorans]|uniref:Sporulation integral membrane protein YlbJ n=1 Tax=Desulfallas thermosapovorans DSM 6562 TaxID=1121431 RepID=A0A5S4ZWL1_9FIRM|nr:sporulation integral membrane protein YlbJ [Desulfallas thermosapovorans]TYO97405.1 sporulation integral membrane protein YlbJ [Desulfallas thermosapovorans DSM 6562]
MPTRYYPKIPIKRSELPGLFWTVLAICFVLAMVTQPKITFQGATMGLKTWWEIVFPSLLPFFIASEILMKLGLVRFIGVLLEPVMRPLFNVPGAGGFVMVIGFTSGYPIGSMVTAQLRRQGLCTRLEAERLMCFTNNSSPLFMLTAVAVGMFGKPELGVVIAGSHYLASIMLGLGLRFYSRGEQARTLSTSIQPWSVRGAFRAMLQHQRNEREPLGKLLGEAVTSSITKLINIGGFIILFAVIIRILNEAGVINKIAAIMGVLLVPLGFAPDILNALASGFFEMTIGTKMASEAAATELQQLMAVGMILGWSGLSIHAQVASMIAQTDLRMGLFLTVRIAHAFLAACFTWLLYKPVSTANPLTMPVTAHLSSCSYPALTVTVYSILSMVVMLMLLILLAVFYRIVLFIFINKR